MKHFAKTLISTAVVTAALIGTTATAQAADKLLLKTPIAFGSHLPALGTPIVWVAEQLKTVSDGKVKMKVYEPGKLVSPKEILDAVSSGKVNSGYATAGYWQGKLPAAAPFSRFLSALKPVNIWHGCTTATV
jgi:TRAP-type mannitol/chloroaromatic compound transport system substrate-binding protein